jgi:hypothetical protein
MIKRLRVQHCGFGRTTATTRPASNSPRTPTLAPLGARFVNSSPDILRIVAMVAKTSVNSIAGVLVIARFDLLYDCEG